MNSKTQKHTPGPWHIAHVNEREIIFGPLKQIVAQHMTFGVDAPGEPEANARLIAAAPELLEALRELLVESDGYEIGVRSYLNAHGQSAPAGLPLARERARAAIAKAEGT